ncbi:IS66 family insertion sequence element accessory protein TnpB, partial [uncultured Vibrio sp.]
MKGMLSAPDIYLYRESVDFRKSINGLAAIIESDTDLSLGSGALFLFTNKQRDKIKVLYWGATHKRLSPFGAVLLMGEGLPKSACRGRFQTA